MTTQEILAKAQDGDSADVFLWGTDYRGNQWTGQPAMIMGFGESFKAWPMDDANLPSRMTEADKVYFYDLDDVRMTEADHDHMRPPMPAECTPPS